MENKKYSISTLRCARERGLTGAVEMDGGRCRVSRAIEKTRLGSQVLHKRLARRGQGGVPQICGRVGVVGGEDVITNLERSWSGLSNTRF